MPTADELAAAIWRTAPLDDIAARVAERIVGLSSPARPDELVDAAEAARMLGVTAKWVRDNKAKLGFVHITDGVKPRLRFKRSSIEAYRDARSSAPVDKAAPTHRTRRPRGRGGERVASAPLLPVHRKTSR